MPLNFQHSHTPDLTITHNCSTETKNLKCFVDQVNIIYLEKNLGFSGANNKAIIDLLNNGNTEYFVFINPDLLLPSDWLENFSNLHMAGKLSEIAVFSGPLLGYDFNADMPTGLVDSYGIYSTIYGRWYDKSQGSRVCETDMYLNEVTNPVSVCGALMILNSKYLEVFLDERGSFFDNSYFMYKEDIEIGLFCERHSLNVKLYPSLKAYHGRGWKQESPKLGSWQRKVSGWNEFKMNLKYRKVFIPFSFLKLALVKMASIFS